MTVQWMGSVLQQQAMQQPNKTAIEFRTHRLTYRTVFERVEALAAFLQQQTFKQHDVIAIFMHNHHHFPIIYLAIQYAGYIALPLNIKLSSSEIGYILRHAEVSGIFYDRVLAEKLAHTHVHIRYQWSTDELATTFKKTLSYKRLSIDLNDTAVMLYTSGTTGEPKGVMLSHRALYATATQWAHSLCLTATDRIFLCTPLFHCAGMHAFLHPALLSGSTIIVEQHFSARLMTTWLAESRATICFGVPAMYTLLVDRQREQQTSLPHLKTFVSAGAPLHPKLIRTLQTLFPHTTIQNAYGQTENGPCATTYRTDERDDKIMSVGRVVSAETDICIMNEKGDILLPQQIGEIALRGPQLMTGYFKNHYETTQAFQRGWLLTGDIGYIDDDGYLYVVGRKKEMLIRAGENIYPLEIEKVLCQMPAVKEAAVVGMEHPIYGEVPKAYVCLKDGHAVAMEDLKQHCVQHLAKYKVPVALQVLKEMPRNATGKVLKHLLKKV